MQRCQAGNDCLGTRLGQRVGLERLPASAPELTPVEGSWHYLNRVRLGNGCCRTRTQVRYEVR